MQCCLTRLGSRCVFVRRFIQVAVSSRRRLLQFLVPVVAVLVICSQVHSFKGDRLMVSLAEQRCGARVRSSSFLLAARVGMAERERDEEILICEHDELILIVPGM